MALIAITDDDLLLLQADLTAFLRWKRAPSVEDLVQETLTRLFDHIASGDPILNLKAYARRIAELVFLEDLRLRRAEVALAISEAKPSDNRPEQLSICLDECRKRCLTRREDKLIGRYYEADASQRKLMAAALNISEGELRKRAMRIRTKLRHCMDECMRNSGL